MKHWSVNEVAADILEREVIPKADRLNIGVIHLKTVPRCWIWVSTARAVFGPESILPR